MGLRSYGTPGWGRLVTGLLDVLGLLTIALIVAVAMRLLWLANKPNQKKERA